MNKKLLFLFWAPLFAFNLIGGQSYYLLSVKEYQGTEKLFVVKPGEGFGSVNYRLHKEGLNSSKKLLYQYAKLRGLLTKIKVGAFRIQPGTSSIDVLHTLIYGSPELDQVTVPEGMNMYQVGKILEDKEITTYKKFLAACKDKTFLNKIGISAKTAEGYLYPDSYKFIKDTPAKTIIKAMYRTFKKKTKQLDFQSSPLTRHEIIILASVVEKETGASFERPQIAGVFHNRLKKRMRLQSDPTTIYGIYENFNGNLRKKHLLEKTPYNTYTIPALPIGPISNPGLEAIRAVLSPANHSYLYFVSQNDGTHVFTKTYKDHLKAVAKYQLNRKNRKGKSWRDLKQ